MVLGGIARSNSLVRLAGEALLVLLAGLDSATHAPLGGRRPVPSTCTAGDAILAFDSPPTPLLRPEGGAVNTTPPTLAPWAPTRLFALTVFRLEMASLVSV